MEDSLREKIGALRERLKVYRYDLAIYRELSDLLFQAGKISAAMNVMEKSLHAAQDETLVHPFQNVQPADIEREGKGMFERGLEYADAYLYEDAVECFQRALELGRDAFDTHYCLAGVYKSLRWHDAAERHCRRSMDLNPHFAPVYLLLGSLLKRPEYLDESVAVCQKALTLDPGCQAAHYDLACYYSLLGKEDEALAAMEKALRQGFCDFAWLTKDPDLESLRKNPEFQFLLEAYLPKPG